MCSQAKRVTHILVGEDNPELADLLLELLTSEGYSITPAATLDEVRRLRAVQRWDLFLMDIFSAAYDRPNPDEVAFLQELSEQAPVIVVSARHWATQLTGADLGIAAVLPKPFDVDDLLALIRTALDR